MNRIYLDYNASAPVRDSSLAAFRTAAALAGNAASLHGFGRAAKRALDDARERLAAAIGARAREIVFTSGGTESDNLALLGVAGAHRTGHVVTSAIEHPAVLEPCRALEARGFRVTRVAVDARGRVDPSRVAAAIADDTVVVSVMWVNNETGAVQPVGEIAEIARARGIPFHSDAVQAVGRVPVDVARTPVDLLALSGHKLGAPTGVGALFVRTGVALEPVARGGGHEAGRRSGSPAVALAVSLADAAEAAVREQADEAARLGALRDRLESALLAQIPGAAVNAAGAARAANTTSLRLPGADGEAVLTALDAAGIAVSSASACASSHRATSHVLSAMGLSPREADDSIRVSLGHATTAADVDNFVAVLPGIVERVRDATNPARAL